MEENENKEQETSVNSTEELKNETVETVKQVKESMKNVDVKEEAKATKGFVTEMFKNPLGKIKEIANDSSNKFFKTTIILLIIWVVAAFIGSINFKYFTWSAFGSILLGYIKTILAPIVSVIVMSLIIFLFNKKSKKSLVTVITTVVTAKIPVIIAKVIALITIFSFQVNVITSRITSLCSIISTVFMFFAIKDLTDEKEDKSAFKVFVIVEAIYVVCSFLISYLGISI